jgi:hypothetical protein
MSKPVLFHAIKTDDCELISLRYMQMSREKTAYVADQTSSTALNQMQVVNIIENLEVTRDVLMDFSAGRMIRKNLMQACVCLFRSREKRLQSCFQEPVEGRAEIRFIRKKSMYLDAITFDRCYNNGSPSLDFVQTIFTPSILEYSRIFITIHAGEDNWTLLVIDINSQHMIYFDPRESKLLEPLSNFVTAIGAAAMNWIRGAQQLALAVDPESRQIVSEIEWPISRYGSELRLHPENQTLYLALENNYDAGICVLFAMDLMDHDIPICYSNEGLAIIRQHFCYCVINGCLPN